jgi:hypothetical protein
MVTLEDINKALKQEGKHIAIHLPEALRDYIDVFSPKQAISYRFTGVTTMRSD